MPQLVNPQTGDVYDVADEDAENEQKLHGLITPEAWHWQNAGAVEQASDTVQSGLQGIARGAMAPGMAIQRALTGSMPDEEAGRAESALGESSFGPEAMARRERHEGVAGLAESAPAALAAAATGGAGLGLTSTVGALGAESAFLGTSQEAVDAVTQKRDFSAKSALMNGLLNLAVGGVFHGITGGFSGAGKAAAGEFGGAAATAEEAGIPRRNLLSEIDPGTVPEARTGGSQGRKAGAPMPESAGAAAANLDEMTESRAIDEIASGKVKAGPLAEAAPAIREQLSHEAARDANALHDFLYDEAGLKVKHEDFARGAAEWTPETVEKQNSWLSEMEKHANTVADELGQARHAGALGEAGEAEIRKGFERIGDAGEDLAARNVAIDNAKRGVDNYIARVGAGMNGAIDTEARQALINRARSLSDALRDGLTNEELFGQNARLQAAHNEPVHEMIGAWKRIENRLYETTGKKWGEAGVGAKEMRADPDRFRKIFEDPNLGGHLFQEDLGHFLDQAETLARNRAEFPGLKNVEKLPEIIDRFQKLRDDLNTAQVLHAATEKMAREGGGHLPGGPGVTGRGAAAAYAGIHVAEAVGRAIHIPVGTMARSAYGPAGRFFSKVLGGAAPELAEAGTATRSILDRYAGRVRGSEKLADSLHRSRMPEALQKFLTEAHAPARPNAPPGPGAPGAGSGGSEAPPTPAAPAAPPGSPANDVRGKVAALAAVGGAGALLAPGQASAAELLPDQQKARDEYQQRLSQMDPETQSASLQAAETFARLQQKTTTRVESAVDSLFSVTKRDVAPRSLSRAQREIETKADTLGVSRATARFMGRGTDDLVSAWQDKSALVSKAVGDPMGLSRAMAQNMGDLPHAEPEVFGKMVAQTLSVLSYLHDTMPSPSGKSVFDPEGYPPTDLEIQEWAARWSGALHPLDALDDLASNDVHPEQMEAVESQWPDAYQMFQTAAFKHIHELGQQGRPLPMAALEQLDRALDLGGAGEPLLSPDFADILNQARQQAEQQGTPTKSPSPMQSKEPERMASSALASLHGGQ